MARSKTARRLALGFGLLAFAWGGAGHAAQVPDGFSIAAVGDIIYLRPSLKILEARSPGLLKVLRGADVAFGNFESNSFSLRGFDGALQNLIDGPALLSPPTVPAELKAMGFTLVSHANNHVFDWGGAGVRATGHTLTAAGLAYAGSGTSLTAARAPGHVVVRGTRVALVAVTATFPDAAPAADAWGPVAARPGVDALHVRATALVSPGVLEALRAVAAHVTPEAGPAASEVRLLGQTFRADASVQSGVGYTYTMDEGDRAGVLASVHAASKDGGLVMLSLHAHQSGEGEAAPPDFEVALAHQAIDAGADIFVAQGPHQLRGIEIYKGRPIFYSLANFAIMQPSPDINPTPMVIAPGSLFTRRAFVESVIAVGRYEGGRLSEIRLYPFELAQTGKLATHGLPQPVSAEAGREIIARLAGLSRPFGTEIAYEDGVGVIHLNTKKTGG